MSDPIRCQFRWTLDEFCAANDQHRRHARAARQVLIIIWFIVCICLFAGIVRLFTVGFNKTSFLLLVFGIAMAIFRFRMFGRGVQAKTFAKLPDHDKDVRYEIYPDRLIIDTSTHRHKKQRSPGRESPTLSAPTKGS